MPLQRWLRLAFWAAAAFTFVMATLPKPPSVPAGDKIQHVLAFATLTLLASVAYSRATAVQLLLAFAVFGALIEAVQMIPVLNRDAELMDWIADVIAVAAVLLTVQTWRRVRRKS